MRYGWLAAGLMLGLTLTGCGESAPTAQAQGGATPAPAAVAADDEGMAAPVALTAKADEIAALFEKASWVHKPGQTGPVLYVLVFRSCPTCAAFKAAEYERLLAAGVDVRWIAYARADREGKPRSKPGERAMVAELWLNRRYEDLTRWYAKAPDAFYAEDALPPDADAEPARTAALAASRTLVTTLDALYQENGLDLAIPTLLWKQDGQWMTYIGYSEKGFAPARAFLTAQPTG